MLLGHTRLLLDNTGNITDTYRYDAWGNLLKGSEFNTPNPFTWNGAYGYEWLEFTGLFHVGAREYDPRTARWLQRDPIDVASGDPNLDRYCFGRPTGLVDPSGLQVVVTTHGSSASGPPSLFDRSCLSAIKRTLGARSHVDFSWSGTTSYNTMEADASNFCQFIRSVKAKHPLEPIYVVAFSNGGNVSTLAATKGAPIDVIIRLGSPVPNVHQNAGYTNVPANTLVLHFFDPSDAVYSGARLFAGATSVLPSRPNWCSITVDAGPGNGFNRHSNFRAKATWDSEIAPYLFWVNQFYRSVYPLGP
jgi:RHS repeat-associated protein